MGMWHFGTYLGSGDRGAVGLMFPSAQWQCHDIAQEGGVCASPPGQYHDIARDGGIPFL